MKERKESLELMMYSNEPCRICGELVKPEDLSELIFVGYSTDSKSRTAHGQCWKDRGRQSEWAYPESEKE